MDKIKNIYLREYGSDIELGKYFGVGRTAIWKWRNKGYIPGRYFEKVLQLVMDRERIKR